MTEPVTTASPAPRPAPESLPRRAPIGSAACAESEGEAKSCAWCGASE
ncbi:MAG TPA: hypothetical protein VGP88_04740 [Thermoplasmata archaeon]|nr:hypothetical protein [Thermoplasmata archaeon]